MCYTNGTSTHVRGRNYGDRTGQGSQDKKEAPQKRQADEGAGESAAWEQKGQKGIVTRLRRPA